MLKALDILYSIKQNHNVRFLEDTINEAIKELEDKGIKECIDIIKEIDSKDEYELLKQWRDERNVIEPKVNIFVSNIIEELLEIYYTDKEKIEIIKNRIVADYFLREPISELNTIDAISDIRVFAINETELMGYDAKKCMIETIKEVSSREQDPEQKEIWKKWKPHGKWQKNKNQDPSTLYKANYEECKL